MIKHPYLPIFFDEVSFLFWTSKSSKGRWWKDTNKPVELYKFFYDKDGYAFFSCGKKILAHRCAWECYHQMLIPSNKIVRHYNDRKEDLSRANLLLGTIKDNSRDLARNKGWGHCKEGLKKATEKITKKWVIIDKDGKKEVVNGLEEYCRNNNLCPSTMIKTSKGIICEHKGYRCYEYGTIPKFKYRRVFTLFKDNIEVLKTNCPVKTCRELGLPYDNIRVASQRNKTYRGYYLRKEESTNGD